MAFERIAREQLGLAEPGEVDPFSIASVNHPLQPLVKNLHVVFAPLLVFAIGVIVSATIAMLLFAAATQGWFLAKNRFYETIALLLIAFTLFRPGFWMDMISAPFVEEAPSEIAQAAAETPAGEKLRLRVSGINDLGDPIEFVALLPIGEGDTGEGEQIHG